MDHVTSKDVASKAGVSQSTVSFILNNSSKANISAETRSRVLRAVDDLGYVHKPSTRSSSRCISNLIAIVVPNMIGSYYPMLVDIIERYAVSRGYFTLLCNIDSRESEDQYCQLFSKGAVKGIVFAFTPNTDTMIQAIEGKIPAVMLGEKEDNIHLDTICLNSYEAGRLLVDHLRGLGHCNIAFLSTSSELVSRATRRRLEGIRDEMEHYGLKNQLIHIYNENIRGQDSFEEYVKNSHELTLRLFRQYPDVTALISPDDISCVGIMSALRELNLRVPEDVALCCFDDTEITRTLLPNITAIDQGSTIRVKIALDLLIDRITNPQKNSRLYKTQSEPSLIVRGSTIQSGM